MLVKEFSIPGVKCKLKYLSDTEKIKDINPGIEKDVLFAECYPENTPLTQNQINDFSIETIGLILNELKKIERENLDFYNHFDINYNLPHIGPMTGIQSNQYYKFELKPSIKFKNSN